MANDVEKHQSEVAEGIPAGRDRPSSRAMRPQVPREWRPRATEAAKKEEAPACGDMAGASCGRKPEGLESIQSALLTWRALLGRKDSIYKSVGFKTGHPSSRVHP
jgi:hypothetical protein